MTPTPRFLRPLLGSLLAFVALNAAGGGWYGLAGAEGVPIAWLEGSPFTSYLVPSLVLLLVVGGTQLAAAVAVFARPRLDRPLAVLAGLVLLGWIAAQVAIIGPVSWLQPAMVVAACLELALARGLHPRPAVAGAA